VNYVAVAADTLRMVREERIGLEDVLKIPSTLRSFGSPIARRYKAMTIRGLPKAMLRVSYNTAGDVLYFHCLDGILKIHEVYDGISLGAPASAIEKAAYYHYNAPSCQYSGAPPRRIGGVPTCCMIEGA